MCCFLVREAEAVQVVTQIIVVVAVALVVF
jgi:hypothetical protein